MKTFMAWLFALIILALAPSVQAAPDDRVIWFDRGGEIRAYARDLSDDIEEGRAVQIRGTCKSACTVHLGNPRVCVSPEARLLFHSAQDGRAAMRVPNPWLTMDPDGNALLMGMMPWRVKLMAERGGWLETPAWTEVSGARLIREGGIRRCRP